MKMLVYHFYSYYAKQERKPDKLQRQVELECGFELYGLLYVEIELPWRIRQFVVSELLLYVYNIYEYNLV